LEEKCYEFDRSIIILDGNASKDKQLNKHKNVMFLPGSIRSENVLYNFLEILPKEDDFWSSQPREYNKQVFLNDKPTNTTDRKVMKKWFNDEKQHWGKGGRKLFNRGKQDNREIIDKFDLSLKNKIVKIQSVIDRQ